MLSPSIRQIIVTKSVSRKGLITGSLKIVTILYQMFDMIKSRPPIQIDKEAIRVILMLLKLTPSLKIAPTSLR